MRRSSRHWRWLTAVLSAAAWAEALAAGPKLPITSIPAGIPAEVRTQIERLYSPSPAQRAEATWALDDLERKAEPAIPFLLSMARDEEAIVVSVYDRRKAAAAPTRQYSSPAREAARALAGIGPRSVAPLLKLLQDGLVDLGGSGPEIVMAAVGLGALRERRAVEGLVSALASPYEAVRGSVAEGLGQIGDPRAVAPLITALQDKNEGVRSSAADALAALKDPKGTEALIDGLARGRAKKQALAALQKLSGTTLGADPFLWRKWWEESGKKRALQVIEGPPPSAPK